jgi:histidinol-phosphatase
VSRSATEPPRAADDPVLAAAVEAARAAGTIALHYARTGFEVVMKSDATPVTQADREAEAAIVDVLSRAFPDHGFLGEESGARGRQDVRWIIDPIDGTRNFVRGIPLWATLIALEEHGEVTCGVVHNAATGELYTARRGAGAWLDGRRLRVSEVGDLTDAFFVHAGLRLVRASAYWDGFVRLIDATERQRGFGDYAGYALVAEGKAEIYAELDLKPWDLAACRILVEEAGGRFTDLDGRPTIYSGTALASNGRLHDAALRLLHG